LSIDERIGGSPEFLVKFLQYWFDTAVMDDLDFIVEKAFGHESEEKRKFRRKQMLDHENPEWIKEFAERLRRLEEERERVKD
jgi:hypothetical protein